MGYSRTVIWISLANVDIKNGTNSSLRITVISIYIILEAAEVCVARAEGSRVKLSCTALDEMHTPSTIAAKMAYFPPLPHNILFQLKMIKQKEIQKIINTLIT